LPRPGKDNHFLVKVLFYDIIEITVHTDYLAALCGKVKTFTQSAAFWSDLWNIIRTYDFSWAEEIFDA
jgi:hypothetical protein